MKPAANPLEVNFSGTSGLAPGRYVANHCETYHIQLGTDRIKRSFRSKSGVAAKTVTHCNAQAFWRQLKKQTDIAFMKQEVLIDPLGFLGWSVNGRDKEVHRK